MNNIGAAAELRAPPVLVIEVGAVSFGAETDIVTVDPSGMQGPARSRFDRCTQTIRHQH